jgi:hypothetical protein
MKLTVALVLSAVLGSSFSGSALAQRAVPASGCQFILGFLALHDLAPGVVGDCLDNQASMANGDALQHTIKGLMAWRKADNWTAFTDGYRTWINGPQGLVARLNTERFPWEGPDAPAVGPTPAPAAVVYSATMAIVSPRDSQRVSSPDLVVQWSGPQPKPGYQYGVNVTYKPDGWNTPRDGQWLTTRTAADTFSATFHFGDLPAPIAGQYDVRIWLFPSSTTPAEQFGKVNIDWQPGR